MFGQEFQFLRYEAMYNPNEDGLNRDMHKL